MKNTAALKFFCIVGMIVSMDAFQAPKPGRSIIQTTSLFARKTLVKERVETIIDTCLENEDNQCTEKRTTNNTLQKSALAAAAAASTMTATSLPSFAAVMNLSGLQGGLTPETFQPVCVTSDGLYRVLQQTTQGIIGAENYKEYGPLIAGGLLRVRLELCVVESFFYEAVGPFIRDNGLSWILPVHETVETFIAGGIFALATTFILIGSTKLVTVIFTYLDFLFGLPARLLGGFTFDRAQGKPVTLDIGFGPLKTRIVGPPEEELAGQTFDISQKSPLELIVLAISGVVNLFGQTLGLLREALEAVDFFVGRYLALWASFYLIIKFLHFKVFPDFPNFL